MPMPIPENFSTPHEEPHRYLRNLLIEFKKLIQSSKDPEELQAEMERFWDVAKQMDWHNKTTGVYHRDEGAKVTRKIRHEFDRYVAGLIDDQEGTNPQDLLDALAEVERLLKTLKVT